MFYAIYVEYFDRSLKKQPSEYHTYFNRLKILHDEGRLLTAGSIPAVDSDDPAAAGFIGEIIIANFESLLTAKKWINTDPNMGIGIYKKNIVKPYKKIF